MAERSAAALQELFDVRGRRVLVTGAASGLGLAIAEVMSDCGAVVILADIDRAGVERAAASLAAAGGAVRPIQVDVADPDQVAEAVDGVVRDHGGLDVAFANAGGGSPSVRSGVLPGVDAGWRRTLDVNLSGTFATMSAAAAAMAPQGSGSIVVTASTAGLRGDPLVSYSYTAAKAAVVNLTRHAALELAPLGIRVNAIAPGPFRTNLGAAARARGEGTSEEQWARTVPMGRLGEPSELKGLALLLASPAGSFMTGGVHPIDGGALVGYPR